MLGIEAIAVYVPEHRISNHELMAKFDVAESFLSEKIGVLQRAVKGADEDTSDMALMALENLISETGLEREDIEALVVVTQNPDSNLPHVSALVQARAQLSQDCATLDLSLGCSGYVSGLSVLTAFLASNGLTRGVLITSDPYSKIVNQEDKNTALLFGDAATATLIGPNPFLMCGPFVFGTKGDLTGALTCREGELQMNGREVFNFAATVVPPSVNKLLDKAGMDKEAVDCYIFHQGSRYIVETLGKRLGLDRDKVRTGMESTGNTVSSSIPMLLKSELTKPEVKTFVLSGFGVGLSWASCLCKRVG